MASKATRDKKKISQNELRRIMNEKKLKLSQTVKKIESPLAKYNNGKLMCILCELEVRSEAVWSVHINGRVHRENIAAAKLRKDDVAQNNFAIPPKPPPPALPVKRPAVPQPGPQPPTKKVKGILKNRHETPSVPVGFFDNEHYTGFTSVRPITAVSKGQNNAQSTRQESSDESSDEDLAVPEGETRLKAQAPANARTNPDEPLPEGFFDDPLLDAKARHVEYKDPIQEEWEKFQREMKEETTVSAQIIADDQEEATAERQLDEIDEQIRNWSRVLDLERKKEEVARTASAKANSMDDESGSSADEADFDEYLDWRAKKSYK